MAVDCELEIGGCSFVKQLKVEEGDGEALLSRAPVEVLPCYSHVRALERPTQQR